MTPFPDTRPGFREAILRFPESYALVVGWICFSCFLAGSRAASAATLGFESDLNGNLASVQASAPAAPTILRPPFSQLSRLGGSASFSVVATGHPAPTYQWHRDGDDIEGATSPTLFLANLAAGDFADYTVTVTNSGGSVTSSVGELILDSDGDRLPDAWEMEKFGNLNERTLGDPDGDGVTNLEELNDGTEPDSSSSRFFKLTLGPGVVADPAMDRYAPGTLVTLTPVPPPGLNFMEWSGALAGVEQPVTLVMDASKSVSARFAESVLDRRWKANVTGRSGAVRALLRLADGKILAGGEFTALQGSPARNLGRLLADLSPDPGFAMAPGTHYDSFTFSWDREVWAAAEQTDGRILVAGEFHRVNGVPRRGLARLHPDGTLDRGFNAANGINDSVRGLAVLGDGRVAIVGAFTEVGGISRNRVALLQTDGTLDASFDPGTGCNDTVHAVALDTGNRLVCAGAFTQCGGSAVGRVVRLNATGALDATFNPGGAGANHEVQSVRKLGDGRFALGGKFSEYNGQSTLGIALLDADGARDPSFTGNVWANSVPAILPLSGGRFLIGGDFTAQNGSDYRYDLAVLGADGTVDLAFNAGSGASSVYRVFSLLDLGGGKALAAGNFSEFSGSARNCLLVFDQASGALETTPPVHAGLHDDNSDVFALLPLPGGKLLAAGAFTEANGRTRGKVARFLPSGEFDPTFDASAAIGSAYSVSVAQRRSDGTLLLGTNTVLRILADGAPDPAWTAPANSNGTVYDFVEDGLGRVYVGGYFSQIGGVTRYGLVRLLADGQIDGSFPDTLPQYSNVNGLALQEDGRILVAGQFPDPGGTVGLVRLNEDGTRDPAFTALPMNAPGISVGTNEVDDVAILADGGILVAMYSAIIDGAGRRGPFRLRADGMIDPTFLNVLTGSNTRVRKLNPLPDGRILVCGDNFSIGSLTSPDLNPRQGIALLNEDGSLAPFDPGARPFATAAAPYATIRTMAMDSAGRVHAGGRIAEFQWRPRAGLARFSTAPELEVDLTGLLPSSALVGQAVALTAAAEAHEGSLGSVFFEASRDGGAFVPVASGAPQGGGVWTGTWKPDYDGSWIVRAVATDFRARRLASTVLPAEVSLPPTDYDEWAAAHFTAGELVDPLVSGPDADPDKDGHKNLDEYHSGSLPKHPGSIPPLFSNRVRVGAQDFPGFVYRARKNASDVSVAIEVSADLAAWEDDPALTVVAGRTPDVLGFEWVQVRTASPVATRVFLRRRLTNAP